MSQIITERDEQASIALATNLPFSEWGTVVPDPRLLAAVVRRVTFNAHILEAGTQSIRLRTSKPSTVAKEAAGEPQPPDHRHGEVVDRVHPHRGVVLGHRAHGMRTGMTRTRRPIRRRLPPQILDHELLHRSATDAIRSDIRASRETCTLIPLPVGLHNITAGQFGSPVQTHGPAGDPESCP